MELARLKNSSWFIERQLAEGGQAITYSVLQLDDPGRSGVMKCLKETRRDNEIGRRFFQRESRIQKAVRGQGIPAVYDEGQTKNGNPCFVSEYIKGPTVADAMRRNPHGMAENVLLQICLALLLIMERIHLAGVIHRDITPRNLLWTDSGLFVIDFGISLWRLPWPDRDDYAHAYGTRPYLPPEAFQHQWTAQSDIYSLGAVFYEMASGKPIFQHANECEIDCLIQTSAPPALSILRPDFSASTSNAIMRCLERRPENRFSSASELATVLSKTGGVSHLSGCCPTCKQLRPASGNYCAACGFSFPDNKSRFPSDTLLIESGPRIGTPIPLNGHGRISLGRLQLNPADTAVSREHLVLERSGNAWTLAVSGLNGGWLNGQRVNAKMHLQAGDQLLCGSTRIRFVAKS